VIQCHCMLYPLCADEVKAAQRLISVMLVSQTDAFDEHCQTQVIVIVVALVLLLIQLQMPILVLCELSDRSVNSVQHRVEQTLTACYHLKVVPHIHHLLHSAIMIIIVTAMVTSDQIHSIKGKINDWCRPEVKSNFWLVGSNCQIFTSSWVSGTPSNTLCHWKNNCSCQIACKSVESI